MLNDSALVRLLNPCSFRRGSGLTTAVFPLAGEGRDYAASGVVAGRRPGPVCRGRGKRLLFTECLPAPPPTCPPAPSPLVPSPCTPCTGSPPVRWRPTPPCSSASSAS